MKDNLFNIENKVFVITGATGLIGRAFCEAVVKRGGLLVVVDINKENVDSFVKQIRKKFKCENILGYKCDVSDKEQVENLALKVIEKFKKIDILVNNAQNKTADFFASIEEFSVKDWDDIFAVNVRGVFLCCQIFGKLMQKQKNGNIINLASTYGVVSPDPKLYHNTSLNCPLAYSASKGAVIMITKQLAAYWAEYGIRVNSITPHGVLNNHEEQFIKNFSFRSPLNRMSKKEELVGALIYLSSDASTYVTGSNLLVEGGWTTW